jgi:formylglycine-generating enzyme required for sulfatase activity
MRRLTALTCVLSVSSLLWAEEIAGEETLTNSLGMKMVRIEPGSFRMGSPDGETRLPSDQWDEQPIHEVSITRSFYMTAMEVSNAQYEHFDPEHRKWRGLRGVSKSDDEAATYVSWFEAMACCAWLSNKEGKPYRLPTEAEWEYGCRAGTQTPYWTGGTLPEPHYRNQWMETADMRVNAKDRALREKRGKVTILLQVGSTPANPWGLHEMHGNVEEWCLDWYGPYARHAKTDPVGPADGMFRVTRGGSHNTAMKYLRSANRSATLPGDKHWLIGFRVIQSSLAQTAPQPEVPLTMNDPSVHPEPAEWNEPTDRPIVHEPIPFVRPDKDHPLHSQLCHHHCPTITWCENGDLLAAWFNTISEIGREMVIVSSRLRYEEGEWPNLFTYAGIEGVLDPKAEGQVSSLLNPADVKRIRKTNMAYALCYRGYIEVPETKTYSFYASEYLYTTTRDAGYDLRVWIDGEEWWPNPGLHSENVWRIALEKAKHKLRVSFVDYWYKEFKSEYWYT